MWCFVHKRNISQAIDNGRPPAGLTRGHLDKCASCREFSRVSKELEKRLATDATALIDSADVSLTARVASTVTAAPPSDSLSSAPSRPSVFRLRPVWAAAASLVVVIGVSLLWTVTSHPAKMPPLDPLFKLEAPRAYLETALQKAESPYQEEILELKQAVESAADYLLSRLDVNLGPKN